MAKRSLLSERSSYICLRIWCYSNDISTRIWGNIRQ